MNWRAIRNRLMPVAFLAALALLAAKTCSSESASAEIRFVVGSAPVTHLRADLYAEGSDSGLGYFESRRVDADGVAGVWNLTADAGMYTLRIEARVGDRLIRDERSLELRDRAVVTIDLERSLQ